MIKNLRQNYIYITFPILTLFTYCLIPSDFSFLDAYRSLLFYSILFFSFHSFFLKKISNFHVNIAFVLAYIIVLVNSVFFPDFVLSSFFILISLMFLCICAVLNFFLSKKRSFNKFINTIALIAMSILTILFMITFYVSYQYNLGFIEAVGVNIQDYYQNAYMFSIDDFKEYQSQKYSNRIEYYITWLTSFAYTIWGLGHIFVIIFHNNRVN